MYAGVLHIRNPGPGWNQERQRRLKPSQHKQSDEFSAAFVRDVPTIGGALVVTGVVDKRRGEQEFSARQRTELELVKLQSRGLDCGAQGVGRDNSSAVGGGGSFLQFKGPGNNQKGLPAIIAHRQQAHHLDIPRQGRPANQGSLQEAHLGWALFSCMSSADYEGRD